MFLATTFLGISHAVFYRQAIHRILCINTLCPLLLVAWSASTQASDIQNAANLRTESEIAQRHGSPLIVLFSRDGCHYCETVRRDYLRPMLKATSATNPAHIREIHVDQDIALIDFEGKPSTHARFSRQQKMYFAPVLAFYGAKGNMLADPIIGVRTPDFYQYYLDDAITFARQRLIP